MENKIFSRNGFEVNARRLDISEEELNKFFSDLQDRYDYLFEELGVDTILFDGELLPWGVLGKGLIEEEFHIITKAAESELNELETNGFPALFDKMKKRTEEVGESLGEEKNFNQKEKEKFAEIEHELLPVNKMKEDLNAYKHQLEIFDKKEPMHFKPFSILKTIKANGSEENWVSGAKSNVEIFSKINNDAPYAIYNIEENTLRIVNTGLKDGLYLNIGQNNTIKLFWDFITQNKEMEGVVLKPANQVYIPDVAPYLKCRNKEYLRLVYGMDYNSLVHKTEKLINGKSIKRKLETSIKEWELGRRLLDVKATEISTSNSLWITLALQLISEQEKESELDPRL